MDVSDKYKLVFVHIRKTGGEAIRTWIRHNDPDMQEIHCYHSPIFKEDYEKYKDYYKFVIVRNSWKICASAYRYENEGVRFSKKDISFRDWMLQQEANLKSADNPFPHQLKYFTDEKKNILVDKIIFYEDLQNELKKIAKLKDMEFTLKKKEHYYGPYDWKKYYNDKANIDLVAEICKEDIEYFHWTFS